MCRTITLLSQYGVLMIVLAMGSFAQTTRKNPSEENGYYGAICTRTTCGPGLRCVSGRCQCQSDDSEEMCDRKKAEGEWALPAGVDYLRVAIRPRSDYVMPRSICVHQTRRAACDQADWRPLSLARDTTIKDLIPGTLYFLSVTYIDTTQNKTFVLDLGQKYTLPEKPSNVTHTMFGNGSLEVSWQQEGQAAYSWCSLTAYSEEGLSLQSSASCSSVNRSCFCRWLDVDSLENWKSVEIFVYKQEDENSGECVVQNASATSWRPETTAGPSAGLALLSSLSEVLINNTTVTDVLNQTLGTLQEEDTLTPEHVDELATILYGTGNVTNITSQAALDLLHIVDIVSKLNTTQLQRADDIQHSSTNRIIQAVEDLGDRLVLKNASQRLLTDTVAMEVWDLNKVSTDVIVGLQLERDTNRRRSPLANQEVLSLNKSTTPDRSNTDAALLLSSKFLEELLKRNSSKKIRLTMSVFTQPRLFQNGALIDSAGEVSNRTQLRSKVISAKVTADGVAEQDLGDNAVTLFFRPIQQENEALDSHAGICAFWDLHGNGGRGAWSEQGCHLKEILQGLRICVCNHLSHFGLLMDVYGGPVTSRIHQLFLTYTSYIGVSLSIIGLSCTVISFLSIRKWRQGRSQQVLFNLALAMLLSWIVFLSGFKRRASHVGCLAGAALLHYFILVSFMWMLVEGVLQYLLVCRLRARTSPQGTFVLKAAAVAWGVPLIPVITLLAVDVELYNGHDQICWMKRTPFYFAFLLPVAAVLITNVVIYCIVVTKLCRRPDLGRQPGKNSNLVLNMRASIGAFVILGLGWLLAFFAVSDVRLVFQYLFCFTTASQGLFIFLIFTARDPTVIAFWRRVYRDGCQRARGVANNAACCQTVARDGSLEMSLPTKASSNTDKTNLSNNNVELAMWQTKPGVAVSQNTVRFQ